MVQGRNSKDLEETGAEGEKLELRSTHLPREVDRGTGIHGQQTGARNPVIIETKEDLHPYEFPFREGLGAIATSSGVPEYRGHEIPDDAPSIPSERGRVRCSIL